MLLRKCGKEMETACWTANDSAGLSEDLTAQIPQYCQPLPITPLQLPRPAPSPSLPRRFHFAADMLHIRSRAQHGSIGIASGPSRSPPRRLIFRRLRYNTR